MQRTISVMVGKGSVKHNSRAFNAANTDPERSSLNRTYRNEDIREVYHELFGETLARYNAKQTRGDRTITDYYDKICSGKQEKLFHEIILQIGNCDDMNAKTAEGELAATVLDEYMQMFQQRNLNLHVFSAHLHLDEATPHLHVDFVPYTTGSKRGLETRVSLKQALAAQGFKGGTRQETEWSQWVTSEKEQLASVMEHHGIQWLQLGTHEKHLSVLDYEKKMRSKEVAALESRIDELVKNTRVAQKNVDTAQQSLAQLQRHENVIELNTHKFDNSPEWQLPEPTAFMTVNAYKTKIVEPFVKKLKDVIKGLVARYLQLERTVDDLRGRLSRSYADVDRLVEKVKKAEQDKANLIGIAKDYKRIRDTLGAEKTDSIVAAVKTAERAHRRPQRFKGYGRQ